MKSKQLLKKTAVDRIGLKLGLIVDIENLPGKIIKKEIPHAMVLVKKFFKGDILVPIDITQVIEVTDEIVKFDIFKGDFTKKAGELRVIKKHREDYGSESSSDYKARTKINPAYAPNLPSSKSRKE